MNTTFLYKMIKIIFILVTLFLCGNVYAYSSFWAPLFNPKILNYRVDFNLDPDGGKNNREEYFKKYGYRGDKLITDLGNGKGPSDATEQKNNEDIKFYYTYPGANKFDSR